MSSLGSKNKRGMICLQLFMSPEYVFVQIITWTVLEHILQKLDFECLTVCAHAWWSMSHEASVRVADDSKTVLLLSLSLVDGSI